MHRSARLLCAFVLCAAFVVPASAGTTMKALVQLERPAGCLVDSSQRGTGCTRVQTLLGPGPFLGSNGLAISPDDKHVYVASSDSDAVTIFARNSDSGKLTQPAGAAASALDGPNSVAVSADGKNVYVTSVNSDSVAVFTRDSSSGALTQTGCISSAGVPGCTTGRALDGADVVAVSPDGKNVYVGAFFGNAVAVFARDASTGALTQPADASGCISDTAADGCAAGLALRAPEGMAISPDGESVFVAAAVSNALVVFSRDAATGALAQANDGSGCIAAGNQAGCTTGRELLGANAVAVSPSGDNVYVTSLFSNSVTSFRRGSDGRLNQLNGTSACVKNARSNGCSLGHGLSAPEGVAVAPGGARVYVAAFDSGAVDTFSRDSDNGALRQKPVGAGCIAKAGTANCLRGRAMHGVGSVAVSSDGKFVYATAFGSDAVGVFKRGTARRRPCVGSASTTRAEPAACARRRPASS